MPANSELRVAGVPANMGGTATSSAYAVNRDRDWVIA